MGPRRSVGGGRSGGWWLAKMDEGLIVLRTDGSVQAFDLGAERIVGLAAGALRIGANLGPLIGRDALGRLLDAAPACSPTDRLGSGELSFQLGEQWITARATRLSDSVAVEPSVLVRFSTCAAARIGAGRDLAARLSRELRGPVAAIRGCSQTLLGGALEETERARRFIEMMDYNADQLEVMADDLDAFAQIQPEWIRDNRRAVAVRPILGGAAKAQAATVIRRGVAVRALPLSDDIVVAAVPQLLERSLQGVVAEVVRAARKGEEIICGAGCVDAQPTSEASSIAEIVVERRGGDGGVPRDGEDLAGSLRMETIRDVVRGHGGWLAARAVAGRLEAVKMFWPLWGDSSGAPRAA